MKNIHFLGTMFLMAAAAEMASGGGGNSAVADAPPADSAQQPPAAPATVKPPGIISQAVNAMRGSASLSTENLSLRQQLQVANERNEQLVAENNRLAAENAGYLADMETLDAALKGEQQQTRSVDERAAQKIAGAGFQQNRLPEQPTQEAPETRESLEAKIAAETDDQKKWALLEKLEALN